MYLRIWNQQECVFMCMHVHPKIPLADFKGAHWYFSKNTIRTEPVGRWGRVESELRFCVEHKNILRKEFSWALITTPSIHLLCSVPYFNGLWRAEDTYFFCRCCNLSCNFSQIPDVGYSCGWRMDWFVTVLISARVVLFYLSVSRIWQCESGRTKRGRWGSYCSNGSSASS